MLCLPINFVRSKERTVLRMLAMGWDTLEGFIPGLPRDSLTILSRDSGSKEEIAFLMPSMSSRTLVLVMVRVPAA